ncbi:hypothetical protein [Rhodococcus sp. NPDC127528]
MTAAEESVRTGDGRRGPEAAERVGEVVRAAAAVVRARTRRNRRIGDK